MNCSMPGFPVIHYLLEFAQTHVHWVSDDIWPSHSLPPSSPPALNLSQYQGLFHWPFFFFFFFIPQGKFVTRFYIFYFGHVAYGMLVPWPGIELCSPEVEVQCLNHQAIREIPPNSIYLNYWIHPSTTVYIDLDPKKLYLGTSLVAQWLGLCTPSAGSLGLIPGRGTRSHMPQLRPHPAK